MPKTQEATTPLQQTTPLPTSGPGDTMKVAEVSDTASGTAAPQAELGAMIEAIATRIVEVLVAPATEEGTPTTFAADISLNATINEMTGRPAIRQPKAPPCVKAFAHLEPGRAPPPPPAGPAPAIASSRGLNTIITDAHPSRRQDQTTSTAKGGTRATTTYPCISFR